MNQLNDNYNSKKYHKLINFSLEEKFYVKKDNNLTPLESKIFNFIFLLFSIFNNMNENQKISEYSLFKNDCLNNQNTFSKKIIFIPIINIFWFRLFFKKILSKYNSKYFINILLNLRTKFIFFNFVFVFSVFLLLLFFPLGFWLANFEIKYYLIYSLVISFAFYVLIHFSILVIFNYKFYNKALYIFNNSINSLLLEYEKNINFNDFLWEEKDLLNYFKKNDVDAIKSPFKYINKWLWFIPVVNFFYISIFLKISRHSNLTGADYYNNFVKKIRESKFANRLKKIKLLPNYVDVKFTYNSLLFFGGLRFSPTKSLAKFLSIRKSVPYIYLITIIFILSYIVSLYFIVVNLVSFTFNNIEITKVTIYAIVMAIVIFVYILYVIPLLIFIVFILLIYIINFQAKKIIKRQNRKNGVKQYLMKLK